MIALLSRIFIPNRDQYSSPLVRRAYGTLCSFLGIFLNLCLFLMKLIVGTISGSVAVTADAFNNLSDAGSSVITLIGFRLSAQKSDAEHPFGHGRFEYISGFIVALIIFLVAGELLKSSIEKIIHPEEVVFSWLTGGILLASIAVKGYMYYYNRRIGEKIQSSAMKATATDSLSDAAATTAVLLSMIIGSFLPVSIDGYFGVLVALFILKAGIGVAKETISPLLGQAPDREFVKQIRDMVEAYPEIIGVHDLIVHDYGPGRQMISLHAEVDASGDILSLHDVIDNIERELKEKLSCDATIHMDPVAVGDPLTEKLKEYLTKEAREQIDPQCGIHDLRIVKGPSHTNVIFDIEIPYGISMSDKEVAARLNTLVKQFNQAFYAVVQVDKRRF